MPNITHAQQCLRQHLRRLFLGARIDSDKLRERQPVPGMRYALACLNVNGIRLRYPEHRADASFWGSGEGRLNLFHVNFASKPCGKVRASPFVDRLSVQSLCGRTFCERLCAVCRLASRIEVASRNWEGTLLAISLTSGNLVPASTTESVRFGHFDLR